MGKDPKRTALFVTCLVDQFFPRVGEATVRLLEQAGRRVEFPGEQTCCGQPAFNMGYREEARRLARRFIRIFEPYEEVVAPSGSCVSMVRRYYPELFDGEPEWRRRAGDLGERVFELTEFLHANGFEPRGRFQGKVTYHDSCHLLRELGIRDQPRDLLTRLPGVERIEMDPVAGGDVQPARPRRPVLQVLRIDLRPAFTAVGRAVGGTVVGGVADFRIVRPGA